MKEEIQNFFKGDIEDSEEILTKYSHDASLLEVRPKLVLFPRDSLDVKALVKWVGENSARQDLAGLSITPRCAGTDMSGGAIGESIILDFSRYMNKLIGWNEKQEDLRNSRVSITVQPGMFYRDFEKLTLERDLILPCYTASKSLNAMGGMYGNNSAGERTLKYGQTTNYVLSAKVVFADGNEYEVRPLNQEELKKKIAQNDFEGNIYRDIYRLIQNNKEEIKKAKPNVNKNSAGYYIWNVLKDFPKENSHVFTQPSAGAYADSNSLQENLFLQESLAKNSSSLTLPGVPGGTYADKNFLQVIPGVNRIFDLNKLLVGSQGTLGIVTEITFKLVPQTKHSKLVAIFMNDIEPLGRLVGEILHLNPETVETYDDKTMKLAVKFFPDFLKNKGLIGMIKFMWSFLPELKMMITGGFPSLILLVEFAGDTKEEVDNKCLKLVKNINNFKLKTHITESEAESGKYWDIRRESFALLRKHVKDKRTAPFIDDVIVRPEFLPKFLPELNSILSEYDLTYTLAGHAGDGNFHVIPLMDFSRSDTAQIIATLSDKVYDLVLKYHGSITAEHNDGIIRTPFLGKMYGQDMMKVFKEIKSIFDLKNIFNPGKKIAIDGGPGTKEYIASHLAIEHHAHHKV